MHMTYLIYYQFQYLLSFMTGLKMQFLYLIFIFISRERKNLKMGEGQKHKSTKVDLFITL